MKSQPVQPPCLLASVMVKSFSPVEDLKPECESAYLKCKNVFVSWLEFLCFFNWGGVLCCVYMCVPAYLTGGYICRPMWCPEGVFLHHSPSEFCFCFCWAKVLCVNLGAFGFTDWLVTLRVHLPLLFQQWGVKHALTPRFYVSAGHLNADPHAWTIALYW